MHLTLLAHGSPDPRHAHDVGDLVERLRASGTPAVAAYLEHDEPTAPRVARDLLAARAPGTTVVALLVGPAYHARVDVPAAVAAMREAAPGLPLAAGAPVGLHPLVLDGTAELIIRSGAQLGPDTGVIVAFAGSRDLRAVAAIEQLVHDHGAALAGCLGVRAVRAAYLDGGPSVESAAARLRGDDRCTDVIAATAMIADGVLRDRIVASAACAEVPVVPGTLASTESLVRLIGVRAAEAQPAPD